MGFDELYRTFPWRPIANCPGRYRLADPNRGPDLQQLFRDAPYQAFRVPNARDEVIVVSFPDGTGLISYKRSDGSFCHTLNTHDGFTRKLAQLGIPPVSISLREEAEVQRS